MIRFGTSGWRAVISDGFTFANVRRVTRAIARILKDQGGPVDRGVAVGMDTRFLAEEFAAESARVLLSEGVKAHLAVSFLPTPVLAFAIQDQRLAGGINITASHNPPEYGGLKFSTADAAPAPPEITSRIESLAPEMSAEPVSPGTAAPAALDPRQAYDRRLEDLVRVEAFRGAGLKVALDSRFGTTRGWLDVFLERHGVDVTRLHDWRDPLFGGGTPDCSGENLKELRGVMRQGGLNLGLANDGDGDRFGIVDSDGIEVSPNLILALLVDYLARTRGWRHGVGRTVATTHLIDRVASLHGFQVHETPVGFKYFNALLAQGKIFLGAEESAGMSVLGHVPEKDGILANLLVAEMVAAEGVGLGTLVDRLFQRVGKVVSRRHDQRFDPQRRAELEERTSRTPARLAGVAVAQTISMDGQKWIREDGAWMLIRISGTEPVVRIYAEGSDEAMVKGLIQAGRALVP